MQGLDYPEDVGAESLQQHYVEENMELSPFGMPVPNGFPNMLYATEWYASFKFIYGSSEP